MRTKEHASKSLCRRVPALLPALILILVWMSALTAAQAEGVPRGVFYELYVRAFSDSDGDGIGDLRGLTQKLDYLNDGEPGTNSDLGVTGLWLMPVFDAKSDHGYDTIDYYAIDPDYGTVDDMRELLAQAHKRGISVIVDLVMNHTSTDCAWFKEAVAGGEKRDWYRFYQPGTDSEALLTARLWGSDTWHESPGGLYYGLFWDGMPDLNLSNPAVAAELVNIAKYWLHIGVDGFRLDAASHFFGYGEYELKQDTVRAGRFLRDFTDALREEYPDVYIVGEAWEPLALREDILWGIDSVFNFDFGEKLLSLLKSGGDANLFVRDMAAIQEACLTVNPDFLDAPFLTNHDQNRAIGMVNYKPARYKLAAAILLTMPGNPYLYYGEEIGLMGAKPDEEIRSPMLWGLDDPAACTFMTSRYNQNTLSVAEQEIDPASILNALKPLITLRNHVDALRLGRMRAMDSGSPKLMLYAMTDGEQSVIVAHNLSADAPQPLNLEAYAQADVLYGDLTDGMVQPYATVVLNER